MDFLSQNFVNNMTEKYANFSGRATRKEYWLFQLVLIVIMFGLVFLEMLIRGSDVFATLFQFATFLPSLALGVRRMHDTNHSGWWIICPIVNLVFACTKGTTGDNRFGADPLVNQQ